MSNQEEDNATPTDAGKGPDLSSQMDRMLKEMQKMREEMKAGQEKNHPQVSIGCQV